MERRLKLGRTVPLAFFLSLLLALAACGDSDSGATPPARSAVQHPPEVQQAIDKLEGEVGFRPIAPTVLPDGIDSTPETVPISNEAQQEAIIAFFPLEDAPAATTPSVLEVTETPAESVECPLCPGSGFTELEISGEPALAEEGGLPEEKLVYYVLYFIAADLLVTLNAEWPVPEGSAIETPTDEMKQQLVLVAESMLAQG